MTQTLEEFRKWVEEKPKRKADVHLTFFSNKPSELYVFVYEDGLGVQMVKTVDEIDLEARARRGFEELKRKFEK